MLEHFFYLSSFLFFISFCNYVRSSGLAKGKNDQPCWQSFTCSSKNKATLSQWCPSIMLALVGQQGDGSEIPDREQYFNFFSCPTDQSTRTRTTSRSGRSEKNEERNDQVKQVEQQHTFSEYHLWSPRLDCNKIELMIGNSKWIIHGKAYIVEEKHELWMIVRKYLGYIYRFLRTYNCDLRHVGGIMVISCVQGGIGWIRKQQCICQHDHLVSYRTWHFVLFDPIDMIPFADIFIYQLKRFFFMSSD